MTKKIQPCEDDFRKWLLKKYSGWSNRIEPSQGMQVGIPDLIFATDIGLAFAELKIASLSDDRLWSREVRPSQIAWNVKFWQENQKRQIISIFLFGAWCETKNTWRVFALEGWRCRFWENGFPLAEIKELDNQEITESVEDFCAGALG